MSHPEGVSVLNIRASWLYWFRLQKNLLNVLGRESIFLIENLVCEPNTCNLHVLGFCTYWALTYLHLSQPYFRKKNIKFLYRFKMRPNNWFSIRVISILAKIWKTTFPKEFFNEIWLKVRDYEYNDIAEIKFG